MVGGARRLKLSLLGCYVNKSRNLSRKNSFIEWTVANWLCLWTCRVRVLIWVRFGGGTGSVLGELALLCRNDETFDGSMFLYFQSLRFTIGFRFRGFRVSALGRRFFWDTDVTVAFPDKIWSQFWVARMGPFTMGPWILNPIILKPNCKTQTPDVEKRESHNS